jgi:hypothetical protein
VATRKQRRRREKEKRHDYEFVYLDSEGNEVEPETVENGAAPAKANGRGSRDSGKKTVARGRRGKTPQPPSWRRVARRGALFAPLFLGTFLLVGGSRISFASALIQTLVVMVMFVPFAYFLDSMMWKSHQRRSGAAGTSKR